MGTQETDGGNIKIPTTNVNMVIGGNPMITSNEELTLDKSFKEVGMKLYNASITSTTINIIDVYKLDWK